MNDGLFLLSLAAILLALFLLLVVRRKRRSLGIPSGTPIYQDTYTQGKILYSSRYRLKGRPDLILKQGSVLIPVEVKTGKTPQQPHYGHVMQLVAYCVLVEDTYGLRPPHGVIRYPGQQFEVLFTPEREVELQALLADMQAKKDPVEVHRNHTSAHKCAACGFRHDCRERLDRQTSLRLDY